MRIVVEVRSGPDAAKTYELRPGQVAQVGRSGWADLSLPHDASLADLHFLLECGPSSCRLRDLSSPAGTFHNGTRVRQAVLEDGDKIDAGRTTFVMHLAADSAVPPPPAPVARPEPAPPAGAVTPAAAVGASPLQALREQEGPLFALLDAARDISVFALLGSSGEQYQSLYEGVPGEQLGLVAPYLVRLPASSPLLERLAREGWGKSWGVYLTSDRTFAEVRKHFRRFLLVRTEAGKELYFRYYDPRVLRVYLPTCTPAEARDFFGPVRCFLLEGEAPEVLHRFAADIRGAQRETVPLPAAGG